MICVFINMTGTPEGSTGASLFSRPERELGIFIINRDRTQWNII